MGWLQLLVGVASAQDGSGADLLDIARRAAVVDEVLAEHAGRIRDSRLFGVQPRVRAAASLSYYLVEQLELRTPEETFGVDLSRAYSGFLVDVLSDPDPSGEATSVFWLAGGGLSYGLQRPYDLPSPGGEGVVPYADLTGRQYTDEQYAVGGQWRGVLAEASWARGSQLDATADGRADLATVEERLQRVQGTVASPFGLRVSSRVAIGGGLENLAVDLGVNDVIEAVRPTGGGSWAPRLEVGFRRSDYGGDDVRSHPRVVGAGVSEDLGWILAAVPQGVGELSGGVRTRADADLAAASLQLALAEGELALSGRLLEVRIHGGASFFHDDGLLPVIGRTGTPGSQGGMDLASALWKPKCGAKHPDCRPAAAKASISFSYRDSWAEELRYVADYAGKPQTYAYLELMGGL